MPAGPLPPGAQYLGTVGPSSHPAPQAVASPPAVQRADASVPGLELPPDVSRSYRLFTDALGTHVPRTMNRALGLARQMGDAVR